MMRFAQHHMLQVPTRMRDLLRCSWLVVTASSSITSTRFEDTTDSAVMVERIAMRYGVRLQFRGFAVAWYVDRTRSSARVPPATTATYAIAE